MNLSRALRLTKIPRVAIVGAGGKTSALKNLAQELPKPVVVSTTTHLGDWQTRFTDRHILLSDDFDWGSIEENLTSGIILITQKHDGDRLIGLSTFQLNKVLELCDSHQLPLLLECDGSHQLPLKAPKINEPPIPEFVDTVVVVAGLSGLGKPLDQETVYNPELFSRLGDLQSGARITSDTLEKVIGHKKGGLKNIPNHANRILLLNQAENPSLQIQAGRIANKLQDCFNSIIIANLNRKMIHTVFEPTAAIILAAGSSLRYGQTKQLLKYHGVTFIKAVIRSANDAGLNPIVVVTGANANTINQELMDIQPEMKIIFNPSWQDGQSTSIRAGIDAIEKYYDSKHNRVDNGLKSYKSGSAIFLLADQPHVTPTVLKRLVDEHRRTLAPVIAPLVDGQRTNPVLFDRETFTDLRNLEGDIGGRGIFSKYPPVYFDWNDFSLILDVDSPADYERLLIE